MELMKKGEKIRLLVVQIGDCFSVGRLVNFSNLIDYMDPP